MLDLIDEAERDGHPQCLLLLRTMAAVGPQGLVEPAIRASQRLASRPARVALTVRRGCPTWGDVLGDAAIAHDCCVWTDVFGEYTPVRPRRALAALRLPAGRVGFGPAGARGRLRAVRPSLAVFVATLAGGGASAAAAV